MELQFCAFLKLYCIFLNPTNVYVVAKFCYFLNKAKLDHFFSFVHVLLLSSHKFGDK